MKFLKFIGLSTFTLFIICAIFFIFTKNEIIAVIGVGGGIITLPCFLIFNSKTESEDFWKEVEDLDQQKIFKDEYTDFTKIEK